MTTWIGLLAGINVGGHRKVPMAQLRELVEQLGHERVRTYVQSGNVVFDGPGRSAGQVATRLSQALEERFGFEVLVMVRSRDELAAAIEADPLGGEVEDPSRYHVLFLDREGDAKTLAQIDQSRYAPERFVLAGRELYLSTPGGIGRSRLAQALTARRVGAAATARNWRTVQRLLALADEAG